MNRIKDYSKLATDISNWIKQYAIDNNIKSLIVGVSGGIDSAVVSQLCVLSGIKTHMAVIGIHSNEEHIDRAEEHVFSLINKYSSTNTCDVIEHHYYRLDDIFDSLGILGPSTSHTDANTKSRLRMLTLYHIAGNCNGIVVGTGNKVEDFGVGFFTKHGDGGVDISPIADMYKTEVRELGKYLGISDDIINAKPTDGLWLDGRTDEDQIGATYEELEWAMTVEDGTVIDSDKVPTDRQRVVLRIYDNLYNKNKHKMQPIPIFKLNQ